jgi:hypothetical protein
MRYAIYSWTGERAWPDQEFASAGDAMDWICEQDPEDELNNDTGKDDYTVRELKS